MQLRRSRLCKGFFLIAGLGILLTQVGCDDDNDNDGDTGAVGVCDDQRLGK